MRPVLPPAPQKCTDEQAVQALVRHRAGEDRGLLAAQLGLSRSGLTKRWQRMGLVRPIPVTPVSASDVARAAALVAAGGTLVEAAATIGRHPSHVRDLLRKRGVRARRGSRPTTAARDGMVVRRLLNGDGWLAIMADLDEPGDPPDVRNRLLQGVRKYCRREQLPVPPAALRGLHGQAGPDGAWVNGGRLQPGA